MVALVAARLGSHSSLLALWRPAAGGPWSVSPPLGAGRLVSSAVGATGALTVLSGSGGRARPESVAGPGRPWVELPVVPAGTATLSPVADGSLDAFAVDGSGLRIFGLAPGATSWRPVQSMTVPVSYGSSG